MRRLATIRRIHGIRVIPDAENIELAVIDGWQLVVKKGEFKAGDLGIYCEIDALLPMTPIFEFLRSRGVTKIADGSEGHRLKTIRLRGCVSQGLLLPMLSDFPAEEGWDVTEALGIKLYEAPIPAALDGEVLGAFPGFIPKTDEERVQNLLELIAQYRGQRFIVTEKLDGTSFTAYLKDGKFGVCGRNYEFDLSAEKKNTYVETANRLGIEEKLRALGKNIAIQGELIGEGIQKNRYQIKGHTIRFFTVFDIDTATRYAPVAAHDYIRSLQLDPVPVVWADYVLEDDIAVLLDKADGFSLLAQTMREGLVFRKLDDTRVSFKAISNKFLLKNE